MRGVLTCGAWLSVAVFAVPGASIGASADQPGTPIDAATRAAVVGRFTAELSNRYVFPARAATLTHLLAARLAAGAYGSLTAGDAFASALTADAYGVLRDKHVRVHFVAEGIPERAAPGEPTADELRIMRDQNERMNYGVERVQRLRGNIGYIDLREFAPADGAAPVLAAAMQMIARTQALIIDLRRNHGGDPETVALLCSYLFPAQERVHVNDLAMRSGETEQVTQFWTSRVPGPYFLARPVYVLTGAHTFSGAEEFAYDLHNLHRATLVGTTTGGGANPGDFVRLDAHFEAFIPEGRSISPVTHTNWEGVGVRPDVATSEDEALTTAYRAAIEEQRRATTDADWKQLLTQLAGEVATGTERQILDP